jgi:hypothetical protein
LGPLPSFSVIVCGDDSLAIIRTPVGEIIYEGDATMFDQSQSAGPLQAAYSLYRKLGVSEEVITLLTILAGNRFVASSQFFVEEKISIDKSKRNMRDTGGSDTTLGNSIVMALAWFIVFDKSYIADSLFDLSFIESTFLYLGFKMKLQVSTYDQMSFLKGMWFYVKPVDFIDYELVWGPLPSRILKMGKSLKHPKDVHKRVSIEMACALFLNDVACSFATFLPVPLIRQFVQNFKYSKDFTNVLEDHQVRGSTSFCSLELSDKSYDQLTERYGSTRFEILETERKMPANPFNLMESPVYLDLALRDYA